MKKPDQKSIQDKINGRKAELNELKQRHDAGVAQYQKFFQANETQANMLLGMIAQLEELLPKPKVEKAEK